MTVLELLEKTTVFLRQKEVASPRLQVELLLAHVLGIPRLQLYMQFDRPLGDTELDALRPLVKRRSEHEPLQYIMGETGFCGLTLECRPGVLIPRPETEMLVEWVLAEISAAPPAHLVDVGTGSGAIALALAASLPESSAVTGTDINPAALALARANQQRNAGLGRVRWQEADMLGSLQPDAVVANLPYLTTDEMSALPPEVCKEPSTALDGGTDGLGPARRLVQTLPDSVRFLALELGGVNAPVLAKELNTSGWPEVRHETDLNDVPRFVIARR